MLNMEWPARISNELKIIGSCSYYTCRVLEGAVALCAAVSIKNLAYAYLTMSSSSDYHYELGCSVTTVTGTWLLHYAGNSISRD